MSPSRATAAGVVFNDLRRMAREQGRLSQELFELHALDGFLARLAVSESREQLVLKGGVLLAAFDPASARARVIRDADAYTGVRVSLTAHLASARIGFHVDVSVGDPVKPAPQEVVLPRILGAPIVLRGYPMAMVHAEKIVTALSRGTANTRWRDFGDIYALAGRHGIDGDELISALETVAGHRAVDLRPLAQVLAATANWPSPVTAHGGPSTAGTTCPSCSRRCSSAPSSSPTLLWTEPPRAAGGTRSPWRGGDVSRVGVRWAPGW